MSRPQRRRPTATSAHKYPRTARMGELLREVIAEELERIGDERLELVAITSIDVDPELNRAFVYYDAYHGEAADAETTQALLDHRVRLQAAIGRQVRARKTPILDFRPDNVIRSAERIEQVLRDNPIPIRPPDPADETSADEV